MAYNDNISSKNEEKNKEIYMYSNSKNTLLNNFSNFKECKTKNFNHERFISEDKLKLKGKSKYSKINSNNEKITNNTKYIRDKGYATDRSPILTRNNETMYHSNKIMNLKMKEIISNGVITGRSNTTKRDIYNVETNMKKDSNSKISMINEYGKFNKKNTKLDNKHNTGTNLLYTYVNSEDIYKNKNVHDTHSLNFVSTEIKNSGKHVFENKNITLKLNKLSYLNKMHNFKLNKNLDNNFRENINNKNYCDDELNKSNIHKCNLSKIITNNADYELINNNTTESIFNELNEVSINGNSTYYNNNICFCNKEVQLTSYNNSAYSDNMLKKEKSCEHMNNHNLYKNGVNSYHASSKESKKKKIINSNLYIPNHENKKNQLNSLKSNTDEANNMKLKIKSTDYCKYFSCNNTENEIEFLEKKIKNKKMNHSDLNSQKKSYISADFFKSNNSDNKCCSTGHYNENADLSNNFYVDSVLKGKVRKKNKNYLTVSPDIKGIKKKEDILNFNKELEYNISVKEYSSLNDCNNSTYNGMHDYFNDSINKRNMNSGMDGISAFCEYNNSENKKDIKNNIIESVLDSREEFDKINTLNQNIHNSKKKLVHNAMNANKNNSVNNEKNHSNHMNTKINEKKLVVPHDDKLNKYKHVMNTFKNDNSEKYLIDSSYIQLNENIISGNNIVMNPIMNKDANSNNYLNCYNYLKRPSQLIERNNNITKKTSMYNNLFKLNNLEENTDTLSSVSTYLSLNSNNVLKVNNEELNKSNSNINDINLKNKREIDCRNENKIKYQIINNRMDDARKYKESNNYIFKEDIYLPRENVVKGSLNNYSYDSYFTFNKNSNIEKSKSISCIKNRYMINTPMYINKDKKSEVYNNEGTLVDNKINSILHKDNTFNNFMVDNRNKESSNFINMNTINIPLNRNNIVNSQLNKIYIPNRNIIISSDILNNKVASNISSTCAIYKSTYNNSNKNLTNVNLLNSTMHNNNNGNTFINNNVLNKNVYNTCDILSRNMVKNNDTVMHNSTINNNKLYNNKETTLRASQNENENFLSKSILFNLDRIKSNHNKKELDSCKSINNSKVNSCLRNMNTKSLTKFHRTVSLRNQSLKKNKSFTATQENINNFKEDICKIDTKYIIKKAVVIGCNYVNEEETRLYGCVNDAYVFCRALVKYFDFTPENILLLTDSLPSDAYICEDFDINRKKYIKEPNNCSKDGEKVEKKNIFNLFNKSGIYDQDKKKKEMNFCNSCKNLDIKNVDISSQNINLNLWPTRINILKAVNWLVRDSVPFGSYVFYFAGKSVQVDNMSGWEGEGYDEAFLCSDPFNRNCEHNIITAVQLKDLLLSINSNSQMTIILDCSGGQTILDPAGTENSWSYIKGCKQKGIWPITNPTDKVHKAIYDITILNNSSMKKYFCKSRFSELIEVESTAAMIDPLLQSISSLPIAPKAYCLCAATWEQISIEGLFPIIEFARVTQLKNFDDYDNKKNTKIRKKEKKQNKEISSNEQKLNKKKSFYEKNFNFSISLMKIFFNNSKNDSTKNVTKFEVKDESKKLCADTSNENYLRNSLHNDSNSNASVNTDNSEASTNDDKGDDNPIIVSHGVFTYCFIEAIMEFKEKELKNNIFEKNNQTYLPMTLKNLITLIQQKIQNVKDNKLKKLNQKPEFTIHPGANASINTYFVHYSKNIHFQNNKCNFINSDLFPFLNVNKAWEEINRSTLRQKKSLSLSSTLINTASSKYFTEQNDQIKNSYSLRY